MTRLAVSQIVENLASCYQAATRAGVNPSSSYSAGSVTLYVIDPDVAAGYARFNHQIGFGTIVR